MLCEATNIFNSYSYTKNVFIVELFQMSWHLFLFVPRIVFYEGNFLPNIFPLIKYAKVTFYLSFLLDTYKFNRKVVSISCSVHYFDVVPTTSIIILFPRQK